MVCIIYATYCLVSRCNQGQRIIYLKKHQELGLIRRIDVLPPSQVQQQI